MFFGGLGGVGGLVRVVVVGGGFEGGVLAWCWGWGGGVVGAPLSLRPGKPWLSPFSEVRSSPRFLRGVVHWLVVQWLIVFFDAARSFRPPRRHHCGPGEGFFVPFDFSIRHGTVLHMFPD